MQDLLLSLMAYFLLPVSTFAVLVLLLPLGNWIHQNIAKAIEKFPYSAALIPISGLIFLFYAYWVFMGWEEEEHIIVSEQVRAYEKIGRWKVERNFHLSLFLLMNALVLNRTIALRSQIIEAKKR